MLYSLHKNNFFLISSFFFFYFSAVGVYVIYLPKILENIGYDAFEIGFIFSIAPLIRFALPFLFLKYIKLDTKVFRFALLVLILCIGLLYSTLENFYLFSLTMLLYGGAAGLILPFMDTYSLSVLKKEVYGRARLFGSIGFIVVALSLAYYMEDNYSGLHFIAVTITFCVVSAYLITKDSNFSKEEDQKGEAFSFKGHIPLWMSILLMQLSFGAFYSFFTIYEIQAGLGYKEISYLWSFGVICEVVLFWYQAKFLKLELMFLMKLSIALTVLRWFLLYLFSDNIPILYFSQSLHAFSFALYHTVTLSFLATIYHDKRLSSQFYYGIGFGLGGFIGSFLAGLLYGKFIFLYSALIALFALIVL